MEVQQLDREISRMLLIFMGQNVVFQTLEELVAFVPLRQHEGFKGKNNYVCGILWLQE
jgi:hypothetical protein